MTFLSFARKESRTFLMGMGVKPDYDYLELKLKVSKPEILRERVIAHCETLNMAEMADDVKPFLVDSADAKRVVLFVDYLKQTRL